MANVTGRPQALLLDYGGVLTTSIQSSFATFLLETGVAPERFREVMVEAYGDPQPPSVVSPSDAVEAGDASVVEGWHASGIVAAVEVGKMSSQAFERALAERLSVGLPQPLPAVGIGARLFGGLQPDADMLAMVRTARGAGLRTGVVSNSWGHLSALAEMTEAFDAVVLSHVEGVRKPAPEIYLLAAARVGAAPEACVFVDDLPVNVEGARAVGMAGVLHRDASITIPELEGLLGVSLGRP